MLRNDEIKVLLYSYYVSELLNKKDKIRRIFRPLFLKYQIEGELSDIVAFNSVNRPDHTNLFNTIISACPKCNVIKINKVTEINPFSIWLFFKYKKCIDEFEKVFKNEFVKTVKKRITVLQKLLLLSDFILYKEWISMFEKSDLSNVKACVVLCDALPMEIALIETCNNKKINTITCQHGVYIPSDFIENVDHLNYRMVSSKQALVWGQFTKELIEKYNPNCKCFICGNPIVNQEKISCKEEYIGVVGDIPRYNRYNQDMIIHAEKYAKAHGFRVVVRLHPTDNPHNYRIDSSITRFDKELDDAVFILAHTTTMIFTYMAYGKKVLRYKSDIPYGLVDEKMVYEDVDDLTVKANQDIDYDSLVKKQFAYCGEESKARYREFFETQ